MSKNNQELKNKLAEKANNTPKGNDPANTIYSYLQKMKPQIEKALPKHMNADRLARIALTTIRTTPKLLQCNVSSLMGAVMQAAQLGLEPGLIGHCYIIPYGKEATFIIGYRGMIDLARRSGNIQSIYAHEVYENDEFDYEYGLEPKLKHKPALKDRGKMIGVYAVAHFKDGGYQFEFMPLEEIEKRRQRSKAANNGPWVTDYEEMAKKTVIRHMFKYLPVSVEIMKGIEQEETVKKDFSEDESEPDFIDTTANEVPEDYADQGPEADESGQEDFNMPEWMKHEEVPGDTNDQ